MPVTHHETRKRRGNRVFPHLAQLTPTKFILLGLIVFTLAGCSRLRELGLGPEANTDPAAAIRQIAVEYAQSGDLASARGELDALDLANPAQIVISLADEAIVAGQPERDALARLAADLGANSPRLQAYLRPTLAPTSTPVPQPPTPTPPPTVAPTDTAAPTAVPPTETPAPTDAPTATPAPQTPRALAESNVNLRGGPGRQYPTVGTLGAGQEAEIIGRNDSGDWWQLDWDGSAQAWVAGTVVKIVGPIDTVAVAEDIPAPPPTAAPRPTSPPVAVAPTAPPKPSVAYVVKSLRMRPIGEGAQRCDGGDHNIFITVIDPAGNPLDGVRVREVFSNIIHPTGSQGKGAGRAEYDIYRGGGGQIDIIDDAGNRISELSRGMSADWPPFDLLRDAGYCRCKPHPDDASCQADLESKNYLFAVGHYVYEVVFQRTF